MRDPVDILDPNAAEAYAIELGTTVQRPITTGIPSWDAACDETGGMGLGDWWFTVIGGASNSGKTRLGLHIMRENDHLRPALITMETPQRGIQRIAYSQITSFGYHELLPRKWEKDLEAKSARLKGQITEYRFADPNIMRTLIVQEFEKRPDLHEIMGVVRELKDSGCRLVILDHLQLVRAPVDDIAKAATEVSEALREFAHGQGLCIVGLSQLNRMASRERDTSPTMHDLWGGTSMESNANQVMMIDHSRQSRNLDMPHLLRTWLTLDKNREGPNRVDIPVEVNFKTGVWREAQPDELDGWPGV